MAEPQPSDSSIKALLEMTGFDPEHDRHIITAALRKHMRMAANQSAENIIVLALEEYLADADKFRRKYDWADGLWGADLGGKENHQEPMSFRIDTVEDIHMSGTTPPPSRFAPSRPHSRAKSRSPAATPPPRRHWGNDAPKNKAEEDAQLLLALANSEASAGFTPPFQNQDQEETLLQPQPQRLQPATRPDCEYELEHWRIGSRIDSRPAWVPSLEKRLEGAPGFLTQAEGDIWGTDRLGGLISILHSIPMARNVLLSIGSNHAGSYGHHGGWWRGENVTGDAAGDNPPDFSREMHRLMAFLDDSDRSHGCVNQLYQSIQLNAAAAVDDDDDGNRRIESRLYELLKTQHRETARPLLHEARSTTVTGAPCDDEELAVFGLAVFEGSQAATSTGTLEELWDRTMWHQALDPATETWEPDRLRSSVFASLGEVVVVDIHLDEGAQNIDLPLVWYPERYLETRKDAAARMQRLWWWSAQHTGQVWDMESRLLSWRGSQGRERKLVEVSQAAVLELQRQIAAVEGRARFRALQELDWDEEKLEVAGDVLTDDERTRVARLRERVELYERRIVAARNCEEWVLREHGMVKNLQKLMAKTLTDPNMPRPEPMTGPVFHLRGIATAKDTIYINKRRPEALVELDDSPRDQWWGLKIDSESTTQPVVAEKVDIEVALAEMWQDSNACLAIYATETAMTADPLPLSPALRQFVKADNAAFRRELDLEEAQRQADIDATAAAAASDGSNNTFINGGQDLGSFLDSNGSPFKRKRRDHSIDSMSSNRAFTSDSDSGDDGERTVNPSMLHLGNSSTLRLVQSVEHDGDHNNSNNNTNYEDRLPEALALEFGYLEDARPAKRPAVTVTNHAPSPDAIMAEVDVRPESPILGMPPPTPPPRRPRRGLQMRDGGETTISTATTSPNRTHTPASMPDLIEDHDSTQAQDELMERPEPPEKDILDSDPDPASPPVVVVQEIMDDPVLGGEVAALEMREREGGASFVVARAERGDGSRSAPEADMGMGGDEEVDGGGCGREWRVEVEEAERKGMEAYPERSVDGRGAS